MKKAFITGITGQDGSYLAEQLLEKGYEVNGLVRRTSTINSTNITDILSNPRLKLHNGDLSDSLRLCQLIKEIQPDEVYNLAAMSHVRVSFDNPLYVGDINGLGVARLLEAIRLYGKKDTRFYQASTSELFGNSSISPQNEDTPFNPASPYSVAKLYAHYLVKNYRESYNMFACCGILFNHESSRRDPTMVTGKIVKGAVNILLGKQSFLYLGNLDSKRDWGYAPEYTEIIWKILQQPQPEEFVIGTGITHTVKELLIEAFTYLNLDYKKLVLTDKTLLRPTEVNELKADPSKAVKKLGWSPRYGLKELVKEMVDTELERQKGV
jgi:GDPmannose 4,6-dehydratase